MNPLPLPALLLFALLPPTATAQAPALLPDSDLGRAARAFFEHFDAGDEDAARAWELRYRSEGALRERPVEERVAAYDGLRGRFGSIELYDMPGVTGEDADGLTLYASASAAATWLTIRFELAQRDPLRIERIVFSSTDPPEIAAADYSDADSLDDLVRRVRQDGGFEELSVALVSTDDSAHFATAGADVGPDTPLHIGSLGKAMTASLVALLIEDGTLDWTTTLTEALPEVPLHEGFAAVTIEELMQHRGGLARGDTIGLHDFDVDPTAAPRAQRSAWFAQRLTAAPALPPGTHQYSNLGYGLLAHVAERAADVPFEELLAARLWRPLGMHAARLGSTLAREPRLSPVIAGAGDMWVPAREHVAFLRLHLAGLRGRDGLLSAATIARLHTPIAADAGYASGWGIDALSGRSTHHGAAGAFYSFVSLDHATPRAFLALTAGGAPLAHAWVRKLAERAAALAPPGIEPPRTTEGARIERVPIDTPFSFDGIELGPDGRAWFAEGWKGTRVLRLEENGSVTALAQGLAGPIDIAFDEEGGAWVTCLGDSTVRRIDPSGSVDLIATLSLPPAGIAAGPDGDFFVALFGRGYGSGDAVVRVDATGAVTPFAQGGGLAAPLGLCFGPDGALYVANFRDGKIHRIEDDGVPRRFATLPVPAERLSIGHLEWIGERLIATGSHSHLIYSLNAEGEVSLLAAPVDLGLTQGPLVSPDVRTPNGLAPAPAREGEGPAILVGVGAPGAQRTLLRIPLP